MLTSAPAPETARDRAVELSCAVAATLDYIYEATPAARAAVQMPELDDLEDQLDDAVHPLDQMSADEWTEALINRGLVVLP